MKKFEYYGITCALTHNLETCRNCKKCGNDFMKVRLDMVEYVKQLHKAFDKACEELETHYVKHYEHNLNEYVQVHSHKDWKEYLLKEARKELENEL